MKYRHRDSGALVEVRDDKVMDAHVWEPVKAPAKAAPRKRTTKSEDSED